MYLRVINTKYDLVEFDLFVTEVDGKTMNVLEMLIDYPQMKQMMFQLHFLGLKLLVKQQ